MKKQFLVTGGSGFLGRSIVRKLLKKGHDVRVLDNNWRGAKEKLSDVSREIDFFEADIRDSNKVRRACKNIDAIVHLSYINGTEYFYSMPEMVLDVGVAGMVNILHGAIDAKVPEIFTASSSEVYQLPPVIPTPENVPLVVPDPLNPRFSYGGGKILSELMTINYGRKFFKRAVIFRPHNVFGPDMGKEHVVPQFILRLAKLTAAKKTPTLSFPIQGTGRETRAFIYIDDFTEGLMRVIEKGKHLNIYHIGSDKEVEIRHIVQVLGEFLGRTLKVVGQKRQDGSVLRRCPDISKLKSLGFKPSLSFEEGLLKTFLWYNQSLSPSSSPRRRGSSS